ncbi:M20/M25/M40 family metallo-hydrolase [Porphyrobacter sp. GA68]|uniref:M20/M25/M40 family metallo-hydrolase n=1 Tax=Porphyrobacter sp. GA68 TaxID=2883480 RepID=UPI001D1800EB|nr:M20/M25/M40 family metallo-hydrolase [Porphyrobacter sp. GA68]
MKNSYLAFAAAILAAPVIAQPADPVAAAADLALDEDRLAWDFVEGITTEVGPRQPGTEAEARGRAWAMDWLNAAGFANVANEPFMMDTWVRGEERAEVVAPFAQPLTITALGNSGATGARGLEAEVVYFPSYADLQAAPDGSLRGKIAFIGHEMRPTQDGSSYGFAGPARWTGPGLAASKGAVAAVIRSIGTESHRTPHTGGTTFAAGVTPIPAAALSNPDADNLERMFARAGDRPIRMKLTLTPRQLGRTESGNVVGEIVGRDPSLPPVLLACHLDSWDLGTGAVDDGAGCGIIAAAARNVASAGQPLRTIRVLFAGAEETGLWGSRAYSEAHLNEPFAVGIESDFGADRIWRLDTNFTDSNPQLYRRLAQSVVRFGVAPSREVATGGADLNVIRDQKGALVDLQQDGTRYFDLHHTPDDTLDKIDPAQLRQNVAVWTQVVGILANTEGNFLGQQ